MFLKISLVLFALVLGSESIFSSKLMKCDSSKRGKAHCLNEITPIKWSSVIETIQQLIDPLVIRHVRKTDDRLGRINVTNECRDAILFTGLALRNFEGWAYAMVDASGKPPSGMLDGTVMDFGSYDGCLKIKVKDLNGKENFRGRYCMVGYKSPLFVPMSEKTPSGESYVDAYGHPPEWIATAIGKAGPYLKRVAFWLGTCVPSKCSEDDIVKIASFVTQSLRLNVSVAGCEVDERFVWPLSAVISLSILGFLVALCVLGTMLDAVIRCTSGNAPNTDSSRIIRILKAFSFVSNTETLFKSSSNGGKLGCFHGIRFCSATWIILGHTYFFTDHWKYMRYRNLMGIIDLFNGYLPAAVLENFTIPVASFFFMSGFLLVFSSLGKLEKSEGRLNIPMFIIHKYWRMTPALVIMITLLFVLPLVNSGPLWNSTLKPLVGACENKWWTNILYINNWWDCDQYCLIHTWYLATLMQCHIVGVILLILSFRWPRVGISLAFLIAIGCSIITAWLAVYYDFPMPAPATMRDIDMFIEYTSKIYGKPFCHMSSYLIGMGTAYLVLKYKEPKINMRYVILGWVLATIGAASSVYGLYLPTGKIGIAFFIAGHRITWTLSIGWLAFACITGYGGIVNRILSWNAFIPLGHLSYFTYLLHPLVMLYKNASLRERVFYGHTELVFEFFSYLMISFTLGYIAYVAVEMPFSTFERMIFQNRDSISLTKAKENKEDSTVRTCSFKDTKD